MNLKLMAFIFSTLPLLPGSNLLLKEFNRKGVVDKLQVDFLSLMLSAVLLFTRKKSCHGGSQACLLSDSSLVSEAGP